MVSAGSLVALMVVGIAMAVFALPAMRRAPSPPGALAAPLVSASASAVVASAEWRRPRPQGIIRVLSHPAARARLASMQAREGRSGGGRAWKSSRYGEPEGAQGERLRAGILSQFRCRRPFDTRCRSVTGVYGTALAEEELRERVDVERDGHAPGAGRLCACRGGRERRWLRGRTTAPFGAAEGDEEPVPR